MDMTVTAQNNQTKRTEFQVHINFYREQLIQYIKIYKINLNEEANVLSEKANQKAKILLAHDYAPNDPELIRDVNKVINDIGSKTRRILHAYTNRIMTVLGHICECIVMNNCKMNPILNMKCINYACFKSDINEPYDNFDYDVYTPFSPSQKNVVMYTDKGIVYFKPNIYVYEPNHVNKDIIWCNKNSLEDILKVKIPNTEYYGHARLQIKSSINYSNIIWDMQKYRFSPIIYFDLNKDICLLYDYMRTHNINIYVKSVTDFEYSLMEECVWYYRLLAGHFSGLINIENEINLDGSDTLYNGITKYIFNSDIQALISDNSVVKSNDLLQNLQNIINMNNLQPSNLLLTSQS